MIIQKELPSEWYESISIDTTTTTSEDQLIPKYQQQQQVLQSIILNDEFFQQCWEQKPCHFQISSNNNTNNALLSSIFSKDYLLSLCINSPITYENNMNIVKYISNERINYDLKNYSQYASKKVLKNVFNEGYTVQFFQPQRFSDSLYYLCASFEEFFGTLAGSSAYLTPSCTQGLAPHWDDVEVFILQTEGTKQWNLWEPSGIRLPDTHSNDIPRCTLSNPNFQLILHPGEILYLPRGTIHEAIALNTFSTHITISVYQKYHMKSLTEIMLPILLEKFFNKPPLNPLITPDIRKGLPINISTKLGCLIAKNIEITTGNSSNQTNSSSIINFRQNFFKKYKLLLHDMINSLTEEEIDYAVDMMGDDFCLNRLPDPKKNFKKRRNYENKVMMNIQSFKSIKKFEQYLFQLRRIDQCSSLFFHLSSEWIHCRLQVINGVNLLLIGTGRDNNRMNHMGHPSLEQDKIPLNIENEEEEEDSPHDGDSGDPDDDYGWVKLTLPARYLELISLLSSSSTSSSSSPEDTSSWISYQVILEKLKQRFIHEEINETLFGLHQIKLLDIGLIHDEDNGSAGLVLPKHEKRRKHENENNFNQTKKKKRKILRQVAPSLKETSNSE